MVVKTHTCARTHNVLKGKSHREEIHTHYRNTVVINLSNELQVPYSGPGEVSEETDPTLSLYDYLSFQTTVVPCHTLSKKELSCELTFIQWRSKVSSVCLEKHLKFYHKR